MAGIMTMCLTPSPPSRPTSTRSVAECSNTETTASTCTGTLVPQHFVTCPVCVRPSRDTSLGVPFTYGRPADTSLCCYHVPFAQGCPATPPYLSRDTSLLVPCAYACPANTSLCVPFAYACPADTSLCVPLRTLVPQTSRVRIITGALLCVCV